MIYWDESDDVEEISESDPLFERCTVREGDGVRGYQCEAYIIPGAEHHHWISEQTIENAISKPFLTVITL